MRTLLLTIMFISAMVIIPACEFSFTLTDSQGSTREISPDNPIILAQGETYLLTLSYYEDHRSCPLGPEGTMFLLDGARWRVLRETQPLILQENASWDSSSSRIKTGNVSFIAAEPGSWILEIMRVCTREGYHGELVFLISEGDTA